MAHFSPRSLAAMRSRVRTRLVAGPPYRDGTESDIDVSQRSSRPLETRSPGLTSILPPGGRRRSGSSGGHHSRGYRLRLGPRRLAEPVRDREPAVPAERLDGDLRAG